MLPGSRRADAVGGEQVQEFRQMVRDLHDAGIEVVQNEFVERVGAHAVFMRSGREFAADHVLWVTAAAAPAWIASSALATDDAGFVAVHATL